MKRLGTRPHGAVSRVTSYSICRVEHRCVLIVGKGQKSPMDCNAVCKQTRLHEHNVALKERTYVLLKDTVGIYSIFLTRETSCARQ